MCIECLHNNAILAPTDGAGHHSRMNKLERSLLILHGIIQGRTWNTSPTGALAEKSAQGLARTISIDIFRNTGPEIMEAVLFEWGDYYLMHMKAQMDISTDITLVILIFISGLMYQMILFPQLSIPRMIDIVTNILLPYCNVDNEKA